ncbi:hypothetical protein [Pedobacter gandavensis]|uniref:hypothetical protein n=1 Tax=Pedobacter gandavensis TaxID=2679963 RepID=UPI00292E345E|nr:hypothetical protein [Pedobacter gandavensis]
MRNVYFIYVVSALWTAWVVSFSLGFSSGFASSIPVAALLGSVVIFTVASPVVIYKTNLGLLLGLIGYLFIIPFNFILIKRILEDGIFNWIILIGLSMPLLVLMGFIVTMKLILKKNIHLIEFNGKYLRLALSYTPIILFALYLILYGKYWTWAMFER